MMGFVERDTPVEVEKWWRSSRSRMLSCGTWLIFEGLSLGIEKPPAPLRVLTESLFVQAGDDTELAEFDADGSSAKLHCTESLIQFKHDGLSSPHCIYQKILLALSLHKYLQLRG